MKPELEKVIAGNILDRHPASDLMLYLASDNASDSERAAFLSALKLRKETPEEVLGFADAIKSLSTLKKLPNTTDIVGTGGDKKSTINVSTAAALVCSALGIRIAKHGNYSITGAHGSADFIKFLGYNMEYSPFQAEQILERIGFLYILAPRFNSSFSRFARVRNILGFPSLFNYLGPITNPVDPGIVVAGSCSDEIFEMYVRIFSLSGKKAAVVKSMDGMDEISPFAPSRIGIVNSDVSITTLDPSCILDSRPSDSNCIQPNPEEAFRITIEGLYGENMDSSAFIALNAAPAVLLNGFATDMKQAYDISIKAMKSGRVSKFIQEKIGVINENVRVITDRY